MYIHFIDCVYRCRSLCTLLQFIVHIVTDCIAIVKLPKKPLRGNSISGTIVLTLA